ncbi:hypothetical protein G4G27_01365 [Sphingomonas sp. So64.6b]|uniref:hypothetical protein n=1 Tax=Sphingomonas sp. So64.6b TaxID=2997354 RepID=UPI0015FFCE9D|nr:hypothetical protein [Sphingomonas sp. So64.6b]QNA82809.1 hypothetical protein G4G27_01365 [Sphingomonas sp. So64.6b]
MEMGDIPLKQACRVPVEWLQFDPINPRFTPDADVDGGSDVAVIRFLNRHADLGELLQSIANSGYVDIEPLIVLIDGGKLIVLEGNRRLAALKLFLAPELAGQADVSLPHVDAAKLAVMGQVTVYRVANRDEARDFIGFKHINGPHRWDSLAKGQFAANWFKAERENGLSLADIAARMGDRHDTIQRMVAGVYVLEQATSAGLFEVEDRYPGRPFSFSHLYTALTRPGYRQFLGLNESWRAEDPVPNPVPEEKLPQLKQVMVWLYGSKLDEVRPVVTSQNPHVKQLAEVLAKPKARAIMMATNNLNVAYQEVDTEVAQFERSLVEAHQAVEQVLKKVSSYDGTDESLYQIANEMQKNTKNIYLIMDVAYNDAKTNL